jgi:hypothetical protein
MKNVHIIPTLKSSRLFLHSNNELQLRTNIIRTSEDYLGTNQHIYITSDEEIKEGDWFIYRCYKVCKCTGLSQSKQILTDNEIANHKDYGKPQGLSKKIILTTDPDLIKDGIQAIDDEFLEWFVKNPSCKNVEVEKTFVTNSGLGYQEYAVLNSDFKVLEVVATRPQSSYKIGLVTKLDDYEYVTEYKIIIPQEEPKQEMLEEASSRLLYSKYPFHPPQDSGYWKDMFLEGAKWQQERMYSEAIEFAEWIRIKDFQTTSKNNWIGLDMKYYTTQELFEQFKK